MKTCDFLVIGGGVIGLSLARELKRRHGSADVRLIEKESEVGQHASGRNSGVLHAGFYYTPDSLKARFTRDGNASMRAYCEARAIPVNSCGKLVVARNEDEHAGLDVLLDRGRRNRIEVMSVTESEAHEIEPRARTTGRALWSPTTASVDPRQVVAAMYNDAVREGIQVDRGARFLACNGTGVRTSAGSISPRYVVNASGLQADLIARQFGFSEHYRIVPFKGLYLYSSEPPGALRTNVYPVPNLRNPFLGVHFTVAANGAIKIGPTAIPALWREHYQGTGGFDSREMADVCYRQFRLFTAPATGLWRLAFAETRKYSRAHMVALAGELVSGTSVEHYRQWGKPGLRAQLVDIKKNRLEMDFVLEGDNRSMHVLNAVSPAFTCALPFASHVADVIEARIG
jgi:L-2-hydroxyglutarate oxidase LhgO